jgi:hypothetical protein
MKRVHPSRYPARRPRTGRPPGRAAQDERERVPLLAAQRRRFIDQSGDVGIQPGLAVIFGVPVVVVSFALLAARGRG